MAHVTAGNRVARTPKRRPGTLANVAAKDGTVLALYHPGILIEP